MVCFKRVLAVWTLYLIVGGAILSPPATAQDLPPEVITPDWSSYPLLMSEFGELCTMCEAYLRCTPDPTTDAADRAETLYFFRTKTFWAQIATIWDYFALWFDPVTSQERPATIYRIAAPQTDDAVIQTMTYLSEEAARIEIDNSWVDRNSGEWFTMDDTKIGMCDRRPIGESMDAIANLWPHLAHDGEGAQ